MESRTKYILENADLLKAIAECKYVMMRHSHSEKLFRVTKNEAVGTIVDAQHFEKVDRWTFDGQKVSIFTK